MLKSDDLSARGLILNSNVEVICTTDDPVDNLEYHRAIREDKSFPVKVLPAFRPDKALNIHLDGFREYIGALGKASGIDITNISALKEALVRRLDFFNENGCKVSDHGLDYAIYEKADITDIENIFEKGLKGVPLQQIEADKFKTHMLLFLGREYANRGWTMQLHLGTIRNNNTKMFNLLGPDTGFDA